MAIDGPATAMPPMSMREVMRAKRARVAVNASSQQAKEEEAKATLTTAPVSPVPQSILQSEVQSSPLGLSLNMWMAPAPAAATVHGTPQSLRHPPGADAAQPAPPAAEQPKPESSGPSMPSISEAASGEGGGETGAEAAAGAPDPSQYGDDVLGYGSDAEPEVFTDVEDEVLRVDGGGPLDRDRLESWRARFAANSAQVRAAGIFFGTLTLWSISSLSYFLSTGTLVLRT